jgi:branched-chain amino acid transport system substrate-binding protein
MRASLRFGGAAAALLLALAGCGKKEEATPASSASNAGAPATTTASAAAPASGDAVVVKIGHVAPLSGPQAHYGKDNENGVRMAIDEINAQKPVIGGHPVRFEIATEDDAGDPRQATAAAQKLCDDKIAGVVGHLNSGTTLPASRIYHDCGIPQITGSASNPDYTKPGYDTAFRIIANDNAMGAAVALYAANKLGVKKVAVIDDRTAYGQGVAEVFKATAQKQGLQVVDQQFTNDKATDFTAILTAVKAKQPDAIFYGGMDPQAGPMLRQLEQLGLGNVKFLGGDGVCTAEIAKLSGNAKTLENVVCATGGASLDKMPGGTAWKAKYDKLYPGQFQVYSPYTYDATYVLVDAMKRADSTDPKVYKAKLPSTDYQGVTARIQFEPNGELKNPATTLYTYKNGVKTPIE